MIEIAGSWYAEDEQDMLDSIHMLYESVKICRGYYKIEGRTIELFDHLWNHFLTLDADTLAVSCIDNPRAFPGVRDYFKGFQCNDDEMRKKLNDYVNGLKYRLSYRRNGTRTERFTQRIEP
jgi:hypothetical protein